MLLLGLCSVAAAELSRTHQAGAQSNRKLVVIVSSKSDIHDISLRELRQLFLSEMRNIGGSDRTPLNHPPKTSARIQFDQTVLRMNPDQVARYWIDRRIRGQMGPPKSASAALVPRVVSRLKNAIGYVFETDLVAGVRALSVDGKSPNSDGYPLK